MARELALEEWSGGQWTWSPSTDVFRAEPPAAALLGTSSGTLAELLEQVAADDRGALERDLRNTGAARSTETIVAEFRSAGGAHSPRWLRARWRSVPEDADTIAHLTGIVTDITAQRCADALARAAHDDLSRLVAERTDALEATNRELEAFAWSVSHDLRAPLRAIDGFSAMLEEDVGSQLEPRARDHLARVRAATRRMGQLIDDLLLLSRVTRAGLRHEDVDLERIAREVAEDLHAQHPDRDVRLRVAPDLHARGDPRLLRIVMENLLGNAWKFTRTRAVAHVDVYRDSSGAIVVEDDGVGFDTRQAERMFAPFQRLHGSGAFEGSGIGLAIVQRIVARHGGVCGATGTVDHGARIWLRLPDGALPTRSAVRVEPY